MKNGIFVTATGTDAGKTYVSALLVKYLRAHGVQAGYFKPALSGALREGRRLIPGDAAQVCAVSGLPCPPEELVAYTFETPVSPHLAARLEGRRIELPVILEGFKRASGRFPFVVVEGCGGLLCPLRLEEDPLMLTDVVRALGLDLLIVSPSGLGAINAAVLTVEHARLHRLPVRGILLNRFEPGNLLHEDNRRQIERLTGIPVTACLSEGAQDLPENPLYSRRIRYTGE